MRIRFWARRLVGFKNSTRPAILFQRPSPARYCSVSVISTNQSYAMTSEREPAAISSTSSGFSLASTILTPSSSSSSSRYLSPNVCDESKRKMQTTVAILEQNPHKFKIMPLKQVPACKRPDLCSSPRLNFERPYVGWRSDPPTMYHLTPSRSTSAYSFTTLNESASSQASV